MRAKEWQKADVQQLGHGHLQLIAQFQANGKSRKETAGEVGKRVYEKVEEIRGGRRENGIIVL